MKKKSAEAWTERFASGDLIRHFKRDRPGSSGTDYHFTPAAPSPGA
jgi:hypothetical protein